MLIDGLIVLLLGMGLLAMAVKVMWASERCATQRQGDLLFWCTAVPMVLVGIVLMAIGVEVSYVEIESLAQVRFIESLGVLGFVGSVDTDRRYKQLVARKKTIEQEIDNLPPAEEFGVTEAALLQEWVRIKAEMQDAWARSYGG